MEKVRGGANLLERLISQGRDIAEHAGCALASFKLPLKARGGHFQRSQCLSRVVVQIARDSSTLFVLHSEKLSGQFLQGSGVLYEKQFKLSAGRSTSEILGPESHMEPYLLPGSGTDDFCLGNIRILTCWDCVVCTELLTALSRLAIADIHDVSNPAQTAEVNPITVKRELLMMRATLRLLKSVFMARVFSWEAAAIQGAGMAVSAIPADDDSFSAQTALACIECDAGVAVKHLPARMIRSDAENFFREVDPILRCDRPHLALISSEATCIDSTGVDGLLRCLQTASKKGRRS